MLVRYVFINLLLILTILFQSIPTVLAQRNQPDSLKTPMPDIAQIKRIRVGLQQNNRLLNRAVSDSLLLVARQFNDPAGQIVALCQIAINQRQDGQIQAANATQAEAITMASSVHTIRETSWAMTAVGDLMNRENGTSLLPVVSALGQVISQTTGKGMQKRGSQDGRFYGPNDENSRSPFKGPVPPSFQLIQPKHRLSTDKNAGFTSPFYMQYADRWLDSLVQRRRQSIADLRQLTEKKQIRDSSRQLSQTFARQGNYVQAYNYYVQYTAYKDSLAAEVTARHLASLRFKQATQKKEAQIKLLTTERQLRTQEAQQQRLVLLVLVGLAGLLLAFSVTLVRSNRQRLRINQQLHDQKEALENTLSELKTTQNQLIQSEKMAALGELTAGIAHEIQNPLNFVNNFSEVSAELVDELVQVQKEDPSQDELQTELLSDLKQNLQKITQHGGRASAIVKGMLEHSRTVTGEKEPTDLSSLIEEQLRLAYHTAKLKNPSFEAQLTTQSDPTLGLVNVVQSEISRVLLNLFNNAFYALQQKQVAGPPDYVPELSIYLKREDQQATVTIWDNGTGIPALVRNKVFQPFFTTKPNGVGTGLGLSLSYDIITKGYGGTLTVDTQEGLFTQFTITLPLTNTVGNTASVESI